MIKKLSLGLFISTASLSFSPPSLSMGDEIQIITSPSTIKRLEYPNLTVYQRTGNEYFWWKKPNDYPTVREDPRPSLSSSFLGAPVTVFNEWPEKLSNASIFPYLLPHRVGEPHKEFYDFVKNWYQSSCAIICRLSPTDSKIIGSGSLISQTRIATARHNFENVPSELLHVRFFRYSVNNTRNPDLLHIGERYIDVPVINRQIAKYGLDAGFLQIPRIENELLLSYAKILPTKEDLFDTSVPVGTYAMYHFAGGKPQISIGEVDNDNISVGAALHNQIVIQAGPGASGAAIIHQKFTNVMGGGISIYRSVESGSIKRRILSFSDFTNPGYLDQISAPYNFNPNFYVIPTDALTESGYEFLHWLDEAHGNRRGPKGNKFPKPDYNVYRVESPHHSTHHIIQIDDLIYLWEYLYRLDHETTQQIRERVDSEASEYGRIYERSLNRQLRFKTLYEEEVKRQYGAFQLILNDLCPSFYDKYKPVTLNHKTGFAWSLWNLFQGWGGSFRADDPAVVAAVLHLKDRSEKIRPLGFDASLWNQIKLLDKHIQLLKRTKTPDRGLEANLYITLDRLKDIWMGMPTKRRRSVHAFNPNEWISLPGKKDGHDTYQVK